MKQGNFIIAACKKGVNNVSKKWNNYRIKNKRISIISNNCWGGYMYQSCNLKYQSPFIGLFLFAPDYIQLLKNLDYYLSQDITFITRKQSKYADLIIEEYPIGMLGEGIEIHFLHYKSNEEAAEKWKQRVKRIDLNNLIVKFCDRDLSTPEYIKEFDTLNYKNKVCFTAKPFPELESVIQLKECENDKEVSLEWYHSTKYYDFIARANAIGK